MFTAPNLKLQSTTKLVETLRLVLKGLSDVLLTSKGENKAFPHPSPPRNVEPLFKLRIENNKNPTLNGGEGDGCGFFIL